MNIKLTYGVLRGEIFKDPRTTKTNRELEEGIRVLGRISSELCFEVQERLNKWRTDEIRSELEQISGNNEKGRVGELELVGKMNTDYRMLNGKDHPSFDNYLRNINLIQRRLLYELNSREDAAREMLSWSYE